MCLNPLFHFFVLDFFLNKLPPLALGTRSAIVYDNGVGAVTLARTRNCVNCCNQLPIVET